MNSNYAAYGIGGAIQFVMRCGEVGPDFHADTGLMTLEVPDGVNGQSHYASAGEVFARLPMSLITTNTPLIADGADEVIISGIPSGVQVEWPDGQTDIVTDDEIRFSVDLTGFYTFRFTDIPYLDKEVVIEAIPAA